MAAAAGHAESTAGMQSEMRCDNPSCWEHLCNLQQNELSQLEPLLGSCWIPAHRSCRAGPLVPLHMCWGLSGPPCEQDMCCLHDGASSARCLVMRRHCSGCCAGVWGCSLALCWFFDLQNGPVLPAGHPQAQSPTLGSSTQCPVGSGTNLALEPGNRPC